mmetsp:Transcript_27656/g.90102  ORF Transcript_27656/g.90102 Transcript_27656/m.90102 type:complete len:363 (-) Transcript_27656:948-2036(-)
MAALSNFLPALCRLLANFSLLSSWLNLRGRRDRFLRYSAGQVVVFLRCRSWLYRCLRGLTCDFTLLAGLVSLGRSGARVLVVPCRPFSCGTCTLLLNNLLRLLSCCRLEGIELLLQARDLGLECGIVALELLDLSQERVGAVRVHLVVLSLGALKARDDLLHLRLQGLPLCLHFLHLFLRLIKLLLQLSVWCWICLALQVVDLSLLLLDSELELIPLALKFCKVGFQSLALCLEGFDLLLGLCKLSLQRLDVGRLLLSELLDNLLLEAALFIAHFLKLVGLLLQLVFLTLVLVQELFAAVNSLTSCLLHLLKLFMRTDRLHGDRSCLGAFCLELLYLCLRSFFRLKCILQFRVGLSQCLSGR